MMFRLPIQLLLLSALSVTSTCAWVTSTTTKKEIHIRSSHPSLIVQSTINNERLSIQSLRGGGNEKGENLNPSPFHWAQVYAIAINVVGLYFPIKAGIPVLLHLMKEGVLTTQQRYIGLMILVFVNLTSTSRFAFSIAPKMVNRTIERVRPDSKWHRKILAPFATIGLIPFTYQVMKKTAIITSCVCLYFYITGLIPQPYQDIYKSGIYYLNLLPMTLGMIVAMFQHYFETRSTLSTN